MATATRWIDALFVSSKRIPDLPSAKLECNFVRGGQLVYAYLVPCASLQRKYASKFVDEAKPCPFPAPASTGFVIFATDEKAGIWSSIVSAVKSAVPGSSSQSDLINDAVAALFPLVLDELLFR